MSLKGVSSQRFRNKTRSSKKSSFKIKDKTGVVYIGHLPNGLEDAELSEYFKQFGQVRNVRVSRTLKSGASKGYGFVQFANDDVAKIAAETMNNYIMFKKSLKAHMIEPEKVHEKMFMKMRIVPNRKTIKKIAEYNRVPDVNETTKRKRYQKKSKSRRILEELGYEVPSLKRSNDENIDSVNAKSAKISKKSQESTVAVSKSPKTKTPSKASLTPITSQKKKSQNSTKKTPVQSPQTKSPKQMQKATTPLQTPKSNTSISSTEKKDPTQTPGKDTPLSTSKVHTAEKISEVTKTVKTPHPTPMTASKSQKLVSAKKVHMAVESPQSDEVGSFSDDEVSFKTPPTKAIQKKRSSTKKVFPKTPVPKQRPDEEDSESFQTPPETVSSKTPQKSAKKAAKVQSSDASPALQSRTVSKLTNEDSAVAKARRASMMPSINTGAKTPNKTSQKISPRVTRSAMKKRKSMV